jgi:uncharacterized DUF497 family protein
MRDRTCSLPASMEYDFEWDPSKARSNLNKHGVVVHTFTEIDTETAEIRIISARKANQLEIQQYEGGQ